jgi:hypothetical protein
MHTHKTVGVSNGNISSPPENKILVSQKTFPHSLKNNKKKRPGSVSKCQLTRRDTTSDPW